MVHQQKLHVRPRSVRRHGGQTLYVSAAHKRAWRYTPLAKISFALWGIMSEVIGAIAVFFGLLLIAGFAIIAPLVIWF